MRRRINLLYSKENNSKEYKNTNNNCDNYNKKYNNINNNENLKKEENINKNNNNKLYMKRNINEKSILPITFYSNSTQNIHKKKIEYNFNNIINDNIHNDFSNQINQKNKDINNSNKKYNDNIKINTRNINNIEENLNISELISQKNNDLLKKTINTNTNTNRNKMKTKLNVDNNAENNNNASNKNVRRINSESNFNIKILPKYLEIFNNCNLFNSSLLILSNIFYINNYIKLKSNENTLKECHKNNKPCLTTILFNVNKYFYYFIINYNNDDQFLISLYNYYISWYSKVYFNENNPNNILLNNTNLETIIKNIYEKINSEFTKINPPAIILNKKVNNENKALNKYLTDFNKNHNSIISDFFMGTYQIKILCSNCCHQEYEYESFSCINFKKFENINNYENFYSCLNNFYSQRNKKDFLCKNCGKYSQKAKFSIYFSPKILTIVLSEFEGYDFVLENKLDLKTYANDYPENSEGVYNLISILCRNRNNNKFSTYFINIYNGLWYCYTDKKIDKIDEMDMNDIPIMLIYQASIKNELASNYKPLKRQNIYKQYFLEKELSKKLNSRKTYYKNEFGKEKNKNSKLNEKIKELEKQLKEEKNKNLGTKKEFKENLAFSNFHFIVEANMQKKKKQIELENELKKEKDNHLKEKMEYEENLKKIQKDLAESNEKYKNLMNMLNYNNNMKEKENNSLKKIIARYPFKLSKNEKMITVIFCSFDESIEYSLICKNTDNFIKIEKLFYDRYPEYKNKINKFYIKGEIINRKESLMVNKINNGDKIIFEF